jgi:hypothetical protein
MSTSNHPEEIEEGEIAPLPESGSEYETESENDEIDEMEDDMMFEDEGVDVATLMTSLLATDEGDTVCTALLGITQQLQMQNKILIKILSEMKN